MTRCPGIVRIIRRPSPEPPRSYRENTTGPKCETRPTASRAAKIAPRASSMKLSSFHPQLRHRRDDTREKRDIRANKPRCWGCSPEAHDSWQSSVTTTRLWVKYTKCSSWDHGEPTELGSAEHADLPPSAPSSPTRDFTGHTKYVPTESLSCVRCGLHLHCQKPTCAPDPFVHLTGPTRILHIFYGINSP